MNRYMSRLLLLPFVFFLKTQVIAKNAVTIEDPAVYQKLVGDSGVALVVFSTPSCGNCQQIKQPFAELVVEPEFVDISFGLVLDAASDEMMALSQSMNIQGVPTFVYFKDGKEVYRSVGGNNNSEAFKKGIREAIQKYFLTTGSVVHAATSEVPMSAEVPVQQPVDMVGKVVLFFKQLYVQLGLFIKRIVATVTSWF